MKKSLVAAGIIVALGVVWTGGAWFTGKQLEGRIADMVQQANAQLRSSAPESGLELSYQDYQRGLFSSHLQLVVKPIAGQANGWLAAGQVKVREDVVDGLDRAPEAFIGLLQGRNFGKLVVRIGGA